MSSLVAWPVVPLDFIICIVFERSLTFWWLHSSQWMGSAGSLESTSTEQARSGTVKQTTSLECRVGGARKCLQEATWCCLVSGNPPKYDDH